MGQQDFSFLVVHREIIPAPVVEVPHASQVNAVAIDGSSRHDRHFRAQLR